MTTTHLQQQASVQTSRQLGHRTQRPTLKGPIIDHTANRLGHFNRQAHFYRPPPSPSRTYSVTLSTSQS